jgi:hypothetical protein
MGISSAHSAQFLGYESSFLTTIEQGIIEKESPMNPLANIWNHPRTSVAGLLLGVASIGSVLAQQGITLGKAGTGTVVSLATGLATVLLGLLAKDPSTQSASAKSTDQRAGITAG